MADVEGTIRRSGNPVSGLKVTALEEVNIGVEVEGTPCKRGHAQIFAVGRTTTDAAGRFSLSFNPRTKPARVCTFRSTVHVCVFDSASLLWQSPRAPVAAVVRFDHDIGADQPSPSALIQGTISICGRPATGYRVLAHEVSQIGYPDFVKPCTQSHPQSRLVGNSLVDSEGHFEIRYAPTSEPPDACSFSINVRVEVFDRTALIWRSPLRPFADSVRFDHELYPECPAGSGIVRVTTDRGDRAIGAQVFVNGTFAGITDDAGQLVLAGLSVGDTLAARLRLRENETARGEHDIDSGTNWNYRVYITSVKLDIGPNGDVPFLRAFVVSNVADVQEIIVARRNALIAFNIRVSVEWEATVTELEYYRDRFLELSELLFNATDGQFLIERLEFADKAAFWNEADYRIYAIWNRVNNASPGAIAGDKGHIRLNPYGAKFPGTLIHEFGHYGFYVLDEYAPGDCEPFFPCTPQSANPGTQFSSDTGGKDACPMRGAQFGCRKKFCSAHPANPHTECTKQGPVDCWSVIAEHYGGSPDWTIWTPISRRAIVDRLPDTGVSLGTTSKTPAGAQQPESYIPVAEWKPRWHIRRHPREGACPDLIARVAIVNGPIVSPVDGAEVTLITSEGRIIPQGITAKKHFNDGTKTERGEIKLHGAHVGDVIHAMLPVAHGSLHGSATIETCATPIMVPLPVELAPVRAKTLAIGLDGVEIALETSDAASIAAPMLSILADGDTEPYTLAAKASSGRRIHTVFLPTSEDEESRETLLTMFDSVGNRALLRTQVTTRKIFVDEEARITSADGQLELALPQGALRTPAQIVIEDALGVELPGLGDKDSVLIHPHRISSSSGDELLKPALLYLTTGHPIEAEARSGSYEGSVELLAYLEEVSEWRALPARVHNEPLAATALIRRLGLFALVHRAGL